MLQRSASGSAAAILKRAEEGKVLVPAMDDDIGKAFDSALDPNNAEKLSARNTYTDIYTLSDPVEILKNHGVVAPDLPEPFAARFQEVLHLDNDTIEGITGLPDSVIIASPASDCSFK